MQDITVVVPVYNGANMIESCIQSIFRAGERIAEIIVVDDGSTDNTLEIAERLAMENSQIRVIHTTNHGCYTARVTGIKAATSPYVASVDVDDQYVSGALDLLASLLERNNADVAFGVCQKVTSFGDYKCTDSEKQPEEARIVDSEQMWLRIMKWKSQEFVNYACSKLYKRELFSELIEADGINQGEDVLITCQIFCNVKRIVEISAPVYLYFQSENSLTRVGFGQSDLDLIKVWDSIVSFMNDNRPDLFYMAEFNRWRTDFTLITRLILANNREVDKKYANDLTCWRKGLKEHWRDLISPHAMPRSREILVLGLRFFYWPTRLTLRLLGRRLVR